MTLEVNTITTPFIFHITVNCYLVKTERGFILIDTAKAGSRRAVEQALQAAGCTPGNLNLIVLTHGDFDHCGNAAYLRDKYHSKVAIHEADRGMVEDGNMFYNRKQPNAVMKIVMGLLFRLGEANQFSPDFTIKAGDNLAEYGFDADVIEIPGHSKGSVGLLTDAGDLFCGDLLANTGKPDVWTIIDDHEAAAASVEKLKGKNINIVYPGHGQPFPMRAFWEVKAAVPLTTKAG